MKEYVSDRILTKEEVFALPNSAKYYMTVCENCKKVFETRACNKTTICKKCKCSISQKKMYEENPQLAKERLEKRTAYNIEHYGVANSYQREDVKEKIKDSILRKYKVDNPAKSDVVKRNIKKTCIEKYGVECSLQSNESKKKTRATWLKNYGVEHPMKDESVKSKVVEKNRLNRDTAVEAARMTCYEKYGTCHPMKVADVQNKIKKKYTYNGINFDSAWELAYWIYNVDNGVNIKRAVKTFQYDYDNKRYDYIPDFEINGRYIEIKGLQFFEDKDPSKRMINPFDRAQDDKYEAKHQCMIRNGVEIITDCSCYVDYVNVKYTNDFLDLFHNQIAFPYPNEDLADKSNDGIIRHFHKSIYEASRKGQPSPLSAWEDKDLILKSAMNRLAYVGTCRPEDILRGFSVAKIAQRVSLFPTSLADTLLKKYLNECSVIVDPFSGFSGRLLGASLNNKVYIGKDINEAHVNESNEIIKYKNLKNCSVEVEDILKKDDVTTGDALFTCPPYGGKEHWNKNNDEVELTCDEWIDICLKKYKCKKYLFVVDHTEKYKDRIVEKLDKKSHFGNIVEYVVLFD